MFPKIIEKLTLKELEALLCKYGCAVELSQKKGDDGKTFFLVSFTRPKIKDTRISFTVFYCDDMGQFTTENIEHITLTAMFPSKKIINPEDLNEINSRYTRGTLSITTMDFIRYSLWISFVGGVTEVYFENQLKYWDSAIDQCLQYIHLAESGVEKLKIQLDDIFKLKKK